MFMMIMKLNEYGVNDELIEFWNKEAGSVRSQIRWAKLEFAERIWLGSKPVLSVSNAQGEFNSDSEILFWPLGYG